MFDDEGWYRTGDVGVLDDDGYLSITDRVSDVIIRGGENISAQEVEEQLLGLPSVAEVAVVVRRPTTASASGPPPSCGRSRTRPRRPSRTCGPTSPRSAWPSRSGPRRSTRSPTSRAPRRARSRSSSCEPSCATVPWRARSRPRLTVRPASRGLALADLGQRRSDGGLLLGDGVVQHAVGDDVRLARQHAGEGVGRGVLGVVSRHRCRASRRWRPGPRAARRPPAEPGGCTVTTATSYRLCCHPRTLPTRRAESVRRRCRVP